MSRIELARRLFDVLKRSKNGRVDLRKWASAHGFDGSSVNGAYKILLNKGCVVKRGQVEIEYVGGSDQSFDDLFEGASQEGEIVAEDTGSLAFAEAVHSGLRNEIIRLKSQMTALETQRDNMQSTINKLRSEYDEAMRMGGEAEDRAQEYARQVDALRKEVAGASASKVAALEEQVRDANDARASAASLLEDAESELADLHAALSAKDVEVETLQWRVETLEKEASEKEADALSMSEGLGLRRQIRDLEVEKTALKAALETARRELEEERLRKGGPPAKDPVKAILDMERLGFSAEQMRKVYATYMLKHLDVDIKEALS